MASTHHTLEVWLSRASGDSGSEFRGFITTFLKNWYAAAILYAVRVNAAHMTRIAGSVKPEPLKRPRAFPALGPFRGA